MTQPVYVYRGQNADVLLRSSNCGNQFCVTRKCRDTKACCNRCASYFPTDVRFREACKAGCRGADPNRIQSKEDAICGTGLEAEYIQVFQIDPCSGNDTTVDSVLTEGQSAIVGDQLKNLGQTKRILQISFFVLIAIFIFLQVKK